MPPATASRALHPADRAVRDGADHPPEAVAVREALAAYAAGDDDSARASLQPVGLASPFLDWKLLIRGLMAHAAGDDSRAAENWKRLDTRRLPAKLAAPVWATFDPAAVSPTALKQSRKLPGQALPELLAKLPPLLAKGTALGRAFAAAEAVVPRVRTEAPHLLPVLAAAFGKAVREGGNRSDLGRLRQVFGPPADDPYFHKLEALAYEGSRRTAEAVSHWLRYADWLATGPADWSPELRRRARAVVLHRAAGLSSAANAPALHRQATDLAPDWPAPAEALLKVAPADEAKAVAERLLHHRPDHLPALDALARLAADPAERLAVRVRALALNPLDAGRRADLRSAAVSAARAATTVEAAAAALRAAAPAADTPADPAYFALRGVVAKKLRDAESAATDMARAAAGPDDRFAAVLLLAVEATRVKLKPAERKPLADALAATLETVPTPAEALALTAAFDQLKADGGYRGSVGHGTRIEALLALTTGPAADVEALGHGLLRLKRWKTLGKLAPGWRRRFPTSPVFPLLEVEASIAGAKDRLLPYRLAGLLKDARRLAERSKELHHRALLDRIAELERKANPFDLFRSLFDEA